MDQTEIECPKCGRRIVPTEEQLRGTALVECVCGWEDLLPPPGGGDEEE